MAEVDGIHRQQAPVKELEEHKGYLDYPPYNRTSKLKQV